MSTETTINVAQRIDALPLSRYQIFVIALCAVVATLDGFDTQAIGFAAPALADAWQLELANFAPVLAASLVGLMVGALVLGPLGDKLGRKVIIIASFALVGLFSLLTALSTSTTELMAYRFLTGIGLGGTIPNAIALSAEYSPLRRRTMLVTIMFCGFPLGAAFGGFLANELIEQFGWQAIFIVGGAIPFALCVVLLVFLPESIHYLANGNRDPKKTAVLLARIDPAYQPNPTDTFSVANSAHDSAPIISVKSLFTDGRTVVTLLIWLTCFFNLMIMYFLLSWLPGVLYSAGLPRSDAFIAAGIFNAGGVIGGITLSFVCDRYGVTKVLIPTLFTTAAVVVGIALTVGQMTTALVFIFFTGVGVIGSQFFLNVIAAGFYPTAIRTTGVGWALGVGRVGAIIAPLLGGALMKIGWEARELFLLIALLAFVCAMLLVVLRRSLPTAAR